MTKPPAALRLGPLDGWQDAWPATPLARHRRSDDAEYDCGAPGACATTGSNPPCRSTYRSDGDADMTAYGRLRENRLGLASVNNTAALAEINARMSRLCTSIKATGVILYTITFNVTNSTTRDLYRTCATQPEYYFNSPDSTALQAAFREIAGQLANLRLVH